MQDELNKAIRSLTYTSETDSPLHAFVWKDGSDSLTCEKLIEFSKTDPNTKVSEASLDHFFSTQTESYDGQSEEEKASVQRFADLRKLISAQLSDVKTFRVGEVKVRYYVVGKTKDGEWAGIWTEAVET